MILGFASDHRGFHLKEQLINYYKEKGYTIIDCGTNSDESCDYPDYAYELGQKIIKNQVNYGIAICGSGIGISIALNKINGVYCAKVSNKEEAMYTRNDNNSNIVAFGEKTTLEEAIDIVKTFVETQASIEEKHQRRVNEIIEYEENN